MRPLHLRPWPILLVFLGGAVGTLVRYLVGVAVPEPAGLPLPTFLVNIVGAFAIGVLLEGLLRGGVDVGWRQRVRLLLGPGFLGGFTTYSSLCVETVLLTGAADYVSGGLYAIASLLCGVAAAAAGVWVASNLFAVPDGHPAVAHSVITMTESLRLTGSHDDVDPLGHTAVEQDTLRQDAVGHDAAAGGADAAQAAAAPARPTEDEA
ncbi:MAG TPA: CrcB family protein [Gryllotalpicola sp.]